LKRRVRYRRGPHHITVTADAPDDHTCAAYLRQFTGRRLNRHHWREDYGFKEVKANPQLALENTVLVCVPHHRLANTLRRVAEAEPTAAARLVETMPQDMKRKMMELADLLKRRCL